MIRYTSKEKKKRKKIKEKVKMIFKSLFQPLKPFNIELIGNGNEYE